uniref:Uncharacterized protein n=1 Tax=Anguilla anguilla TaxID=7936 RepID=A0A0E9WLJ9_ANGAN
MLYFFGNSRPQGINYFCIYQSREEEPLIIQHAISGSHFDLKPLMSISLDRSFYSVSKSWIVIICRM